MSEGGPRPGPGVRPGHVYPEHFLSILKHGNWVRAKAELENMLVYPTQDMYEDISPIIRDFIAKMERVMANY